MKFFSKIIIGELLSILGFGILLMSFSTAAAQQLKPKEIVYSRLPTDLNQSPTGANSPTIWATGQDGANDRQLTTGMEPRISDDGRYLLFRRIVAAAGDVFHYNPYASQAQGQLWVRDLANNSETMILAFNGNRLIGYSFSPESNQGNYQIILDYGTLIYKMNLDGTGAVALEYYFGTGFPREGDYFPVLRRGDSRIAMATSRGCNTGNTGCQIVTRTLGAELPQNIPNTSEGDNNPSWSNDNQFIGFATIDSSRNYIYESSYYPYFFRRISKIKPDGTSKTQLFDIDATYLNDSGIAFGMIWTEDNSKIIAAARIGGTASLYAFKTDGSGTYTRIPLANGNAPDFVGGIVQPRTDALLIANGGGLVTDQNGNFTLNADGTPEEPNLAFVNQFSMVTSIGEPVAGGRMSGGGFGFQSGFIPNDPLAPTAASVTIGGRVLTAKGKAVSRAVVILTAPDGATRRATANSFGYYRFTDVAAGATYVLSASAKGYVFASQVVTVNEELTDLNFTAQF